MDWTKTVYLTSNEYKFLDHSSLTTIPNETLFLIVGIALTIITGIFLYYVGNIMGFGPAWLFFSILMNGCVILLKFILSPSSLYSHLIPIEIETIDDPNLVRYYLIAGLLTFIIYLTIFGFIYLLNRRVLKKNLGIKNKEFKILTFLKYIFLIIILGIIISFSFIPILFVGFSYLGNLITGGTEISRLLRFSIIFIAFILITLSSTISLKKARQKAEDMRDGTIFAIFFWIGIYLLLSHHILWIAYMGTLSSIWPFRTFVPSEK